VRRPEGVREEATGVHKIKKKTQIKLFWIYFFFFWGGGWGGGKSFFWGGGVGFNFGLGVHKYQKIENPCTMAYPLTP